LDVRAYPVSRRHPQFSRPALAASLLGAGIEYQWQGKALGGMRKGGYAAPTGWCRKPARVHILKPGERREHAGRLF